MADIRLQNVSKKFGSSLAVDNVSLTVVDHEFLVILGPSGCGKSTTLRLIAGLEQPDTGAVHIGERHVTNVPPRDRDVAMVFQNYALYPHMTAYQNMAFGLRMRKTPKAEIDRRVRAAAETLGITPLLNRRPGQLSGGERQRVAVGRAIVRDPAVFLFDEPLSNLDAQLRVAMRSELIALQERLTTTMVYVTHDQVEAMMMGHRVVVMNAGKVQQIAAPQEVYRSPANRFVAEFIGSPPMNLLAAEIRAEGEQIHIRCGAARLSLDRSRCTRLTNAQGAVTLGVRPEDVHLAQPEEQCHNAQQLQFAGTIDSLHVLGAETIIELKLAGSSAAEKLTVRAGPRVAAARHAAILATIDVDNLHFFDGTTGARI